MKTAKKLKCLALTVFSLLLCSCNSNSCNSNKDNSSQTLTQKMQEVYQEAKELGYIYPFSTFYSDAIGDKSLYDIADISTEDNMVTITFDDKSTLALSLSELCNPYIEEDEGDLEYTPIKNSVYDAEVSVGTATDESDIVIPSYDSGKKVVSTAKYGFKDCKELESVTFPDTLETISGWSFSGCDKLSSVSLTNSVTSIQDYAFENCTSLKNINLKKTVNIGPDAFSGSGITDITIPATATFIGGNPFTYCKDLDYISVSSNSGTYASLSCNVILRKYANEYTLIAGCKYSSFPSSARVTSISENAFRGSSIRKIDISTSKIYTSAFQDCTELETVNFKAVAFIGANVFENCSSLKKIEIPMNTTQIAASSFARCGSLESITVNSGNTVFNDGNGSNVLIYKYVGKTNTAINVVRGCKNSVLPDDVTSIGSLSFSGTTGLTSLKIPSSVKYIGQNVFSGCTDLKSLEYDGTMDEWNAIEKSPDNVHCGEDDLKQNTAWSAGSSLEKVCCSDGDITVVPEIEFPE